MGCGEDETGTDAFVRAVLAVEEAWARLDGGGTAAIMAAVELGRESAPVLVRAAERLTEAGERATARRVLARAVALDGPTAHAQLNYARALRADGEVAEARHWYRGAMLRARPDAVLAMELAGLESGPAAGAMAALAVRLPCRDRAAMASEGDRLAQADRRALAFVAYASAHEAGCRDASFLQAYATTIAGGFDPAAHAALTDGAAANARTARLAAAGRLAVAWPVETVLATARRLEAGPDWVGLDTLAAYLRAAVTSSRPFAWIRLGDGEARLLLAFDETLRPGLGPAETAAVLDHVWQNWFGGPVADAGDLAAELADRLKAAIAEADLLGVASAARLTHDPHHYPWCAALARHVASLPPGGRHCTESLFSYPLNEADPFLAGMLHGLDWLGVIGPHQGLAARLGRRLGIAATREWVIPGEGRQGGRVDAQATLDRVLAELALPRPGAVVLVAGGLLGKLYCVRVKALGGVALDIGALADAWVGINSRGSSLDAAMRHVLPA